MSTNTRTIPELLNRREAADALRVSLATLDNLIRDGKIGVVQPGGPGAKVSIPATEIERALTPVARASAPERDTGEVRYNDEWSRAEDGDEFLDDSGFPLSGEALAQAKAALRAERAADAAKQREETKVLQASRDRQAAAHTALRDQRQRKLTWLADPNGGLAVLDALDPFTIAPILSEARKAAAEQAAAQAVIDANAVEDGE